MSAITGIDPETSPADAPAVPGPLAGAVERARTAAVEEASADIGEHAGAAAVGEYLGYVVEDEVSVSHHFAADLAGYHGWHWSVTLAALADGPVTVSEVVLLPGDEAMVAPAWVPWQERVRPGDLGPGDLLPTEPEDSRLVPAYVQSDDPAVEEVAVEIGLGRTRVLSREGRLEAAERWRDVRGPGSDMARAATEVCATCGFFTPLAGSLRAGFGACANEYSPADGSVVSVEFGCGAHSELKVEQGSPVHVSALVYDDGVDLERISTGTAAPAEAEAEPAADAPAEAPATEAATAEAADTGVVVEEETPQEAVSPAAADAPAAVADAAEAPAATAAVTDTDEAVEEVAAPDEVVGAAGEAATAETAADTAAADTADTAEAASPASPGSDEGVTS
ncbi:hypothetical protein GCM10010472_50040 [Pseudonocardia halophobica]|uniref:DUF3027 domain-containing protein n=1 Tax=Pseudonocardia halophobica TaxID=29401 RepID=A0A9W6LC07_9PSEU|nr:DUF3027 domain-containing protein [Pseudonocardia halophobica]GLL15051.1 hypothetical protein GCM10017577_62000 [Pseudonocardia halophobica]